MADYLIETKTEVDAPDGSRFVSHDSVSACRVRYRASEGYSVREVRGYEHPRGLGFVVTERR